MSVPLDQARLPRVGLITYASRHEPFHAPMMDWVVQGLARLGYQESSNMALQRHYGDRDRESLAQAATRLAQWEPDVIVSMMTNADIAIKQATEHLQTPIVCWSMDPLDSGLIASMQRPGGRLTGIAFPPGMAWLQLRVITTLLPQARKIGYLHNPGYAPANGALEKFQQACRVLGLVLDVREVLASPGITPAIASLKAAGADALVVGPHEIFNGNGVALGQAALSLGLPAIGQESVVRGGGVAAFMPDFPRIWEAAAGAVVRILQGKSPADMPIDRHIAPLMLLNPGAAAALGLEVPAALLDEASSLLD